jgi:hypothetical protein
MPKGQLANLAPRSEAGLTASWRLRDVSRAVVGMRMSSPEAATLLGKMLRDEGKPVPLRVETVEAIQGHAVPNRVPSANTWAKPGSPRPPSTLCTMSARQNCFGSRRQTEPASITVSIVNPVSVVRKVLSFPVRSAAEFDPDSCALAHLDAQSAAKLLRDDPGKCSGSLTLAAVARSETRQFLNVDCAELKLRTPLIHSNTR